jgi:hypothetical protein
MPLYLFQAFLTRNPYPIMKTMQAPKLMEIPYKAIGLTLVCTAYIMSKGQVVYFTATHLADRYMRYFM